MKFKKKSIKLKVVFAKSHGILLTLEGVIDFETNDAIITGTQNERWPINRKDFELTYSPVAPIQMGEDGEYFKKPFLVDAEQSEIEKKISIHDGSNFLIAKPGDWIITDSFGKSWVVNNDIFKSTYEAQD